jgi:hypothetical protein
VGVTELVADWSGAAASLLDRGWALVRGAVPPTLATELCGASKPPWYRFPAEEGVVRQAGFGSYLALIDADPMVQDTGHLITDGLTAACRGSAPPVPDFNEVQWSRYPEGNGFITAHRDPAQCGGVVAVMTLAGSAPFRIWSAGLDESDEWFTQPGDLVLLRGGGWPDDEDRRPRHEAESPLDGERYILTFRHNRLGAGVPYQYA